MRARKHSLSFLLIVGLLLPGLGFKAQAANTGSLSGVIKDTNGMPMAGAVVTLLEGRFNPKVHTRVVSDGAGRFEIRSLVPGFYSLSVEVASYSPLLRTGIEVLAGKIAELDLVLQNLYQQALGTGASAGSEVVIKEDIESILRTASSTRPILRIFDSDSQEPSVIEVKLEADRSNYRKRDDFQGVVNVYTTAFSTDPEVANLGGIFTQFALAKSLTPRMEWIVSGVGSDAGYAEVDSALNLREVNGHNASVRLSFGQLPYVSGQSLGNGGREDERRMNLFNLDFQDEVRVSDFLSVAYGAEFEGTNPAMDVRRFRPRMMIGFQPSRNHRFAFARTTSLPRSQRTLTLPEGESVTFSSPFQHEFGSPLALGTSRVAHSEVSSDNRITENSSFNIAAYSDSFSPGLSPFWGGLPEGQRPSNKGVRVAYQYRLSSRFDGTIGYTYGGGLCFSGDGIALSPEKVHVLVARFSTEIPSSQTRVTTTYRWVSSYSITLIDPYQELFESSSSGVSLLLTQSIPYFGRFIPGKLEAQFDVRALATKTNPDFYSMASFRRLEFLQPTRSVRGGIQLKF
ncbi:MAG TPA: carboxypeptidase-like regulatory domain-containing protein [Terriglobia bacterium]|nr:carboxypeptidase-like regulatory domain-containing protein [Terriglobia bacterium]